MKPEFALSLSFDGIRLLIRAAGGWRTVGEVALDARDMAGELAELRAAAARLESGPLRCKLIIPNDQIRYLTVETAQVGPEDSGTRDTLVRRALDGATPYEVEELAYDTCVDGDVTHVAAVARETLAEAEAFATEHKFSPVSFVAIPGDAGFLGEPFFGPTRCAATLLDRGETVEPDGIAVVVIGPVSTPRPTEPNAPHRDESAPDGLPDAPPAPGIEAENAGDVPDLDEGPNHPPQPDRIEIPQAAPDDAETAAAQVPGFSSRRGTGGAAPALGSASRSAPTMPVAARASLSAASTAAPADEIPKAPEPPPEVFAASLAPPAAKAIPRLSAAGFLSRRKAVAAEKASARTRDDMPGNTTGTARARPAGKPPAPRRGGGQQVPVPAGADPDERQRLTIFGAREADIGGKPRFLGLILTAVLLLFLAGVAAWAAVFMDEDALSGLFGRSEPRVAETTAPAPQDPAAVAAATRPTEVRTSSLDPAEPTLVAPEERLTDTDAAVLDALTLTPPRESAPARDPAPDAPSQMTADTGGEPAETGETANDMTDAERTARYAATGIWGISPDAPGIPQIVSQDDIYIASIDPAVNAQDAVALAPPGQFDTDLPMPAPSSPSAQGTAFALDDQGRVIPTPEGALTPDGFTVFSGRPPIVPPPTPTRFEQTPELDTEADRLADLRPRPRPGALVEQSERVQLGGLTRDELGGLRPRVRPENLQLASRTVNPDAVAAALDEAVQTPEPSAAAIDATAQAVAASLAPRNRPADIARQAQAASTAVPQRVASAATVAPRIPSTASVAKQATVKNALNLRQLNLIGVYGTASNRRALVRLPNGRYQKVQVGDSIDGGRVSAIGEGELRYQKGGRNLTLTMPRG